MIPPVPEDVSAALEAAVLRCPDKWSLDAQAFVLARASSIRPEDVEDWLDVAEALLRPKNE
jgi:hypothetical protein